ncbi:hypothetical protein FOCC_FOCC014678 [Frankliniella occidentalis]|nr:hypothetical protein FOCC_FOCC014678 [Frankliniella occidentalis]
MEIDIRRPKLSYASLARKRKPEGVLTVHMDGKKVPPLFGRGANIERQPVLVTVRTGKGISQLFGAHVLPGGTGKKIANDVLSLLNTYGLADLVKCVCSDTTSSNTGWRIGAMKLLEDALYRQLIYLACRHHSSEVIPKHHFDELIEKSSSPDIGKLCKRFEKMKQERKLIEETFTQSRKAFRNPRRQLVALKHSLKRLFNDNLLHKHVTADNHNNGLVYE